MRASEVKELLAALKAQTEALLAEPPLRWQQKQFDDLANLAEHLQRDQPLDQEEP